MRLVRAIEPTTDAKVWAVERDGYFRKLTGSLEDVMNELDGGMPISVGHPFIVNEDDLLPCVQPTKIICVGLNYQHHADEMGKEVPEEPLIFMKPVTALLAPGGTIQIPEASDLVHHEGELAIVVGRRARKISRADANNHILGYTCANDVTARDIQRREQRYTRAKGYDTFAPVGPALVTRDEFKPQDQRVVTRVNGELRQDGSVDDFIFDVDTVVSFISHIMTLEPGDVIFTGTPMGVGPLVDGDEVEVEIDGIGVLSNRVAKAHS